MKPPKTEKSRKDADMAAPARRARKAAPTPAQRAWLARGLDQPGGKLPIFAPDGREIPHETIRACLAHGWAEPWFANPIKPDWIIAKLTPEGRRLVEPRPAAADPAP